MTAASEHAAAVAQSMAQAEAERQARDTHAEALQATLTAAGDVTDSTRSPDDTTVNWPN